MANHVELLTSVINLVTAIITVFVLVSSNRQKMPEIFK